MRVSRRRWLGGSALLGGSLALAAGWRAALAADAEPIVQPAEAAPRGFIARAFDMRRLAEKQGDQPYGAVVVRDGRIVGQAPSRVIAANDPTAHAETEAIRDAARRLGTRNLGGAVLYSSSRPCPMCEAAAYWAGIAGMVHGADIADAGPPRLGRC
ncbi:MAG: nucleoside deaminase [Rhodospirillales bacterium]